MKKVSKIKRFSILALIFLFSINTFAAIVSDNDGSAFVTKAEFDALKNSFADQIDNYNKSIDGKIDGAIAAYLARKDLSSTTEIPCLINNMSKLEYGMQDTTFTDLSTLNVVTNNLYGVEGLWNVAYCNGGAGVASVGSRYLWWNNKDRRGPTGSFQRGDNTTTNQANYANHIYTKETKWINKGTEYFYLMSDTTIEGWHRLLTYNNLLVYTSPNILCAAGPWTLDLSDLEYPQQVAYIIYVGTQGLGGYRGHLYKYQDKDKYDGANYNASSNINSVTINTIDEEKKFIFDDTTPITNIIQYGASTGDKTHTPGAEANGGTRNGNFNFKYLRQKRYTHNQNEWINISASTILDKPIYKYNGIPVCRELTKEGKISLNLKFNKVECNGKKPTKCSFLITNCPFPDAANSLMPQFDSTNPNGWLLNEDINLPSDETLYTKILDLPEALFVGVDKNIGVTLYLKCVPDQGAISVIGVKDNIDYSFVN